MPSEFSFNRRIEFYETDMAGIVHFSNFYRYMEQAEHEFFRAHGLKIIDKQSDGSIIGWPRVSAQCTYEGPAFYDDVLEVRLRVNRKGVKSITYDFEFYREDQRIARGRMKSVCCIFRHGEKMQSIEIPPEYGSIIEESATLDGPIPNPKNSSSSD